MAIIFTTDGDSYTESNYWARMVQEIPKLTKVVNDSSLHRYSASLQSKKTTAEPPLTETEDLHPDRT